MWCIIQITMCIIKEYHPSNVVYHTSNKVYHPSNVVYHPSNVVYPPNKKMIIQVMWCITPVTMYNASTNVYHPVTWCIACNILAQVFEQSRGSLGVVVLQMVTHTRPHKGDQLSTLWLKQTHKMRLGLETLNIRWVIF